jgi:hypothetical protein
MNPSFSQRLYFSLCMPGNLFYTIHYETYLGVCVCVCVCVCTYLNFYEFSWVSVTKLGYLEKFDPFGCYS